MRNQLLHRLALMLASAGVASCATASGAAAHPSDADPAVSGSSAGGTGFIAVPAALADATQLLVVTTANWDAVPGALRRFVRDSSSGPWRPDGDDVPVVVGRTGLAWGVGFERDGPRKREGDGRAPAGVFPVGTAFGFAPADSMRWVRLPYLPLTERTECVDDVASDHYNQLVDRAVVSRVDWTSAEQMRRVDQYRMGFVVDYNSAPAVPGRGSCIFFHIWAGPGSSTVGCTAMAARELARLLDWVDPRRRPAIVQLPVDAYRALRDAWRLPAED